MPSEGRGILSPVRLPVPPLQQVVGSFEVTTHSVYPRCGCSCGCHFTLLSFAARAALQLCEVVFEFFGCARNIRFIHNVVTVEH